ncbi:Hsp70 family protein [Streptomyces antibioticus]|uniref:Hsp70 family protein n=1 Tax=Streptomyces antibioticus TaxID=1890 RepID=UPI0036F6E95C
MARLGIDLGTWSVATLLVDAAGRRLVPDPVSGQFWSRAAVALAPDGDGGWLVGRSAEELRATHPDRYRDNLKQLLDSDRPVYVGGAPYAPSRLLALLVERALREARSLTSEPIDELALGIPVVFEAGRQQAVRDAVREAGFDGVVELVAEPVAAARGALGADAGPGVWLVFDLGGGTLDLALVRIGPDGGQVVLDTAGDLSLGGFAIDDAVVEHLCRAYGLPDADEADPQDLSDLVTAARSLKHQLSDAATAYARNPFGGQPRQLTLTLEELRRLVAPVVDAACGRAEELLAANGLGWHELAGIVPTGGASRSPAVVDRLKARGLVAVSGHPPELVTAYGLLTMEPEPEPEPASGPGTAAAPGSPLSLWREDCDEPISASRAKWLSCVATLEDHTRKVTGVAFSPDGRLIATTSIDRTAKIWHGHTGALLHTLHGHDDWVNAVAFSPDGRTLATVSDEDRVRLWDAAEGNRLMALSGHDDQVNTVAFSAFGMLATGGDDERVILWDGRGGRRLRLLDDMDHAVASVAFSPDGRLLVVGAGSGLFVYDVADGGLLFESDSRHVDTLAVAFAPDGRTYATADEDGEVRIWDVHDHRELHCFDHKKPIDSLAYHPSGDLLATGSSDGTKVRLWHTSGAGLAAKLNLGGDRVKALAFSPDATMLAVGTNDHTVEIWGVDDL